MSRWLLAALLSISGCSFALSGPDPDRPRNKLPECDSGKSLVVLDYTMAAAMGVATLSLVSAPDPEIALLPLAIGALYLGGAVSGNSKVNKCRAAMEEYSGGYSHDRFADRNDDEDRDEDDDPRRTQPRLPPPQMPPPQMPPQQMPPQQMPPRTAQQMPPPQMPPQQVPPQPQQQQQPQQVPAQMPQQPPQPPPAKAKPPARGQRPPAPPEDDDWTDFWREVP